MIGAGDDAGVRVVRVIGALFGVGSVIFVALLAPAIATQSRVDVPAWWTAAVLMGVLLVPVAMTVGVRWLSASGMRALAAATALGYLSGLLTLPLVQENRVGVHDTAPWILGLTAVGATAAAIAWRSGRAWCYVGGVGLLVALDRIWTAEVSLTLVAVQDAAYATFFCSVFCALAIGAQRAARSVDRATRAALAADGQAAVDRATARERQRIDALVHDEVLATLLLASRASDGIDGPLRAAAAHARDRLRGLVAEEDDDGLIPVGDLVAQLRAAVTAAAPDAAFTSMPIRVVESVPATVAESLLAAASEALRNGRLHAGPTAQVTVQLLEEDETIVIRVEDNGVGFEPASVPPTRLGVAGSIVARMTAVDGAATVRSTPGAGTVVMLQWPAR